MAFLLVLTVLQKPHSEPLPGRKPQFRLKFPVGRLPEPKNGATPQLNGASNHENGDATVPVDAARSNLLRYCGLVSGGGGRKSISVPGGLGANRV